ncbi:hypothetical protein HZH68_009606 [Vespula germanica]|uniref:Uncharacterized protein n=1 Tax=Vespula germanica TaxID=30212 RepID=A0A834JW60_VESGE|nr:hypothetical protein HZH68_009606 [Vespula germanica]
MWQRVSFSTDLDCSKRRSCTPVSDNKDGDEDDEENKIREEEYYETRGDGGGGERSGGGGGRREEGGRWRWWWEEEEEEEETSSSSSSSTNTATTTTTTTSTTTTATTTITTTSLATPLNGNVHRCENNFAKAIAESNKRRHESDLYVRPSWTDAAIALDQLEKYFLDIKFSRIRDSTKDHTYR